MEQMHKFSIALTYFGMNSSNAKTTQFKPDYLS